MPYELGRLRGESAAGPSACSSGGADALTASGARIETEMIELSEPFDNEVDASFELIRLVAERVRAARADDAFPVLLSGSCFAGVGAVAGLEVPPGWSGSTPMVTSTSRPARCSATSTAWASPSSPAAPGRRSALRCSPSRSRDGGRARGRARLRRARGAPTRRLTDRPGAPIRSGLARSPDRGGGQPGPLTERALRPHRPRRTRPRAGSGQRLQRPRRALRAVG